MSPVDVAALRRMAISEGGLLTDEIRCQVWPRLLNVAPEVLDQEPGIATYTQSQLRVSLTSAPHLTNIISVFQQVQVSNPNGYLSVSRNG